MSENLYLKKAVMEQLDIGANMIEQGRAYLKSQGIDQWQGGYPNRDSVWQDIEAEKGYFLTNGQDYMAYLCMDFDGEPAYNEIKGEWLTVNELYVVIHRLAFDAKFRGQGLAARVFALAEQFAAEKGVKSIKVDTDGDNKIMQHLMQKAGFTYCGKIWFQGGDKLAYEKQIL